MSEGIRRFVKEKVVKPIEQKVVEARLRPLELEKSSFRYRKLEKIPQRETGNIKDLTQTPRGAKMLANLSAFFRKERKAQLGNDEKDTGAESALYHLEQWASKEVLRDTLDESWTRALEAIITCTSTHWNSVEKIERFLQRSKELGEMSPVDAEAFTESLTTASDAVHPKGYTLEFLWSQLIDLEIANAPKLNPYIPEHASRRLLYETARREKTSLRFSPYRYHLMTTAVARTKAATESPEPTDTTLDIADTVADRCAEFGGEYSTSSDVMSAALRSKWAQENFNGDLETLMPKVIQSEIATSMISRETSANLPLLMDDHNVAKPFNPNDWRHTLESSRELARVARGIPSSGRIFAILARCAPLDTPEGVPAFAKKYLGDSKATWEKVAYLNNMPPYGLDCLKYFYDRKPKSLATLGEHVRIASLFDIDVPRSFQPLLTPLEKLSIEKQQEMIAPAKNGLSKAERLLQNFTNSRLIREGKTEEEAATSSTKAAQTFRKKIERLRASKDENAKQALLKEISLQLANEGFEYFDDRLERVIASRTEKHLGVMPDEAHLSRPAFIDSLSMYMKTERDYEHKNKTPAKEMLSRFLRNETATREAPQGYPYNRQENQEWLATHFTEDERALWLGDMESRMPVTGEVHTSNVLDRIKNFIAVANQEMAQVPEEFRAPQPFEKAEEFEKWFAGLDTNKIGQADWYAEMKIQAQGVRQTRTSSAPGGALGSEIIIRKEVDPIEVLMMGSRVNGSCLDAGAGNSWSTFTNASEVNKGVLWLENEKGTLLGRVLIAIDEHKKIVRFPTYYATNGLNLNPFVNAYLREWAPRLGLQLGGSSGDVRLLFCDDWYKDPEIAVGPAQ